MIDKDKKNTKGDPSEDPPPSPSRSDKNLENEIDDIASDPDFLKIKSILDDIDKDSEDK